MKPINILAAALCGAATRALELPELSFPLAPVIAPHRAHTHIRRGQGADASRPVVLMHGLGDASTNPGMQSLVDSIQSAYPGKYAVAVPVADGFLSFITRIQDQVDQFASIVKSDPQLAGGFDAVGLSQGGIIVRGYIEQYNDPPVYNYVSICGVEGGEYDCPLPMQIIPFICTLWQSNPYRFLFNGSIPLSFSDYWVEYGNQQMYLTENTFLPYVNNEVSHNNSLLYKRNILSLNNFVLIGATQDTVIYPWQAEQFGGYVWNSDKELFNFTSSEQYKRDLIGLRTLYAGGRLQFEQFDGDHLGFNQTFWDEVVLPYFNN